MSEREGIRPTVIELIDSSDGSEAEAEEEPPSPPRKVVTRSREAMKSLDASEPKPKEPMPGRISNRRKSVHHSIRSVEDLSFESLPDRTKRANSADRAKDAKKKRWEEDSNANEAVENNLQDPEIIQAIKRIAYCRVFTNYLLQQYNMLAIDFKLYSNIDLLMIELKKRVDIYISIRRSRQGLRMEKGSKESA